MESIGIRELRQNASRYVRKAKAGKRIAVTERGKLAAYLTPAEEPSSILDRLQAEGKLIPATGDLRETLERLGPPPELQPGQRPLSETLAEMRAEERF